MNREQQHSIRVWENVLGRAVVLGILIICPTLLEERANAQGRPILRRLFQRKPCIKRSHRIARRQAKHAVAQRKAARRPATPRPGPDGVTDIDYNDLKMSIPKGQRFTPGLIPDSVRRLNNRRVRIRGYIYPPSVFRQGGITQFVLARDLFNSSFTHGPIDELIVVYMAKGGSVDFTTRPIDLEGTFRIKLVRDPGSKDKYVGAYELSSAKLAKPKKIARGKNSHRE